MSKSQHSLETFVLGNSVAAPIGGLPSICLGLQKVFIWIVAEDCWELFCESAWFCVLPLVLWCTNESTVFVLSCQPRTPEWIKFRQLVTFADGKLCGGNPSLPSFCIVEKILAGGLWFIWDPSKATVVVTWSVKKSIPRSHMCLGFSSTSSFRRAFIFSFWPSYA